MNERFLNRRITARARVLAAPAALGIGLASRFGVARAQAQATVRVTGWTSSGDEFDLLSKVLKDFQAKTPNIKVEYQPIPSDYATKIQTDIAAGTVADVMYVDSNVAPDLMSRDVLLPLDDSMAKAGFKAEDYYPGLIKAFQYHGKTYGLPKGWSGLAMVYGKKAFADAGITTPPATWDELKAAGKALKDKAGSARICIPPDIAREFAFHYAAGGTVTNPAGNGITIDSPEGQQAMEFYFGLYKDGIATTPADAGAQWPGDALAKGLADLVFEGNWVFPFLKSNAPDLQFGIAEMPAGPKGKATLAFTVSYSIFAKTKVADAAWEVVKYLTGPDGMATWTSLGLEMPSRPGLAPAWQGKFPDREPFLKGGDYAKGWQIGPGGQKFVDDANAEMQSLFAGKQDPKTTLTKIADVAKKDITLAK